MSKPYQRIPNRDSESSSTSSSASATADTSSPSSSPSSSSVGAGRRFAQSESFQQFSTKFQAACWVLVAILTAYYGRLFTVMWDPVRSNPPFIILGWIALTIVVSLFLYGTVYLPRIRQIDLPFDLYNPTLVPITTVTTLVTVLAFIIGLWPAYGLLTPLVVIVELMGSIFIWHFIPSF